MGGIQGIGPVSSGMTAGQIAPAGGLGGGRPLQTAQLGQASSESAILSLSSTSMTATSESLLVAESPMLASNEAIGAALLMLVLEYLQASDPKEKDQLTAMILALAGMQQQSQGGGQLMLYSSSSLSLESTQLTIATSQGLSAYAGAAASGQQAPPADAGAGLNVLA